MNLVCKMMLPVSFTSLDYCSQHDLNCCHVSVKMDPGRKLKLVSIRHFHMASRSVQNMMAAAEVGTYDECFQQTEANKS